ncbi:MAG: hypothetical protein MUE37_01000 [Bacteroidales bacterium]|jgi:hypothetical protein|nr:hypothetical protein [Bacteroidales bacterium]
MKTNLFVGCDSLEKVEQRFQELSKVFSGQNEMMGLIKADYTVLRQTHSISKQGETAKGKLTMNAMVDALHSKVKSEGIHVEIIKDWLWVSGKTFEARDDLKELGFRYSSDKKSWYWRDDEKRITGKHDPLSFDEIRSKYGSREVILL